MLTNFGKMLPKILFIPNFWSGNYQPSLHNINHLCYNALDEKNKCYTAFHTISILYNAALRANKL